MAEPTRRTARSTLIAAAFDRISEHPEIGRALPDVSTKPVRVWRAFDYLIVYRSDVVPIPILRVWHGARAPWLLRDAIRDVDKD